MASPVARPARTGGMTVDGPRSWTDPRGPRPRLDALGVAVVGAFVLTSSVTAIMGAAWMVPMRRMLAARSWPAAPGVVKATTVYETKAQPPLYGSTIMLTADVEYTPAGGRPVLVEQAPVCWDVPPEEARRLRPADGAAVEVRYNPADPRDIFLEAWTRRHTVHTGLFAAGVVASLGLLPLVVWKAITRRVR